VFAIVVSGRSNALIQVMCLIYFETQLTAVLHDGSFVSFHNCLSSFLDFNRYKPDRPLCLIPKV
jgi:hypothetical protein